MELPGFSEGQSAQNAVVAGMYFVVLIVIVIAVVVAAGIPSALSQGSSGDASQANLSGGSGTQSEGQSQPENQSEDPGQSSMSGGGTSTSTGITEESDRGSTSGTATERISERKLHMTALRRVMDNSSRVNLVSTDVRNNELYVRYTQANMSIQEVRSGVGTVSGAYVGMVATGSDLEAVHGRLVDETGLPVYTFTQNRSAAKRYNNGQISDQEYRRIILNSLKRTNQTSTATG